MVGSKKSKNKSKKINENNDTFEKPSTPQSVGLSLESKVDNLTRLLQSTVAPYDANRSGRDVIDVVNATGGTKLISGDNVHDREGAVKSSGITQVAENIDQATSLGLAKTLANFVPDPVGSANTRDIVEKLYKTAPDYIRQDLPGKELVIGATLNADINSIDVVNSAINKHTLSDPTIVAPIKRYTNEIQVLSKLPETNLKIYTSERQLSSLVVEDLGFVTIAGNLPLETQIYNLAILVIKRYGLDKPSVLKIASNKETQAYDDGYDRTTDGLSPKNILQVIRNQRAANNDVDVGVIERNALMRSATITSNPDGRQVTTCYDGLVKNGIITRALEIWSENIIPLPRYIDEIRATIPHQYNYKKFREIEMRYGQVYYFRRNASLQPLIDLELQSMSAYFYTSFLNVLDNVAVRNVLSSSIASALSVDNRVSTNQSSPINQILSRINQTGNKRIRSIVILSAIFNRMRLSISFNQVPNVIDVVAATLYLLFIPAESIGDESYIEALRVTVAYLSNSPYNTVENQINPLINRLQALNWPFTRRYPSELLELEGSPFNSDGAIGRYRIPFNMRRNATHVDAHLLNDIRRIAPIRFRLESNLVGSSLASVLSLAYNNVSTVFDSYADAVYRVRGCIPNELAEHLDYENGAYQIKSEEFMSYFLSLGRLDIDDTFQNNIDTIAAERLAEYEQLALDMQTSLYLARSVVHHARPSNTRLIDYTTTTVKMVNTIWGDTEAGSIVSDSLSTMLAIASGSGKDGYQRFVSRLCYRVDEYNINEPLFRVIESTADILRANLSSMGVVDAIVIYPGDKRSMLDFDARFEHVLREAPFLSSFPGFEKVDYHDLINRDDAVRLVSTGVIVTGRPFHFKYSITPRNVNTRLESDALTYSEDVGLQIGDIKWNVGMYGGESKALDYESILNRRYSIAIMTPLNLRTIDNIGDFLVNYTSADRNAIYVKEHTFAYTRSN